MNPNPETASATDIARQLKRQKAKQARTINEAVSQMYALQQQLTVLLHTTKPTDRPAINSPADAAYLVEYQLRHKEKEVLWVIILDRRNRVIAIDELYEGSVNSSQVRIGEVFREAIRKNASAIIPVHNHPSGDPTPSPDDVAVTRAMVQAGKLLDIEVLDHLVIGFSSFVSLKERGLGFS